MGRQLGKPYALPFGNLHCYPRCRGQRFLGGRKTQFGGFPKGSFDESESVQVVQKLSEMGIDFIEVSGGNYESPQMLATKDSTRKREAFFIDYAEKARAVSQAR